MAPFNMADSVIISDYRKFIMSLVTQTKNWQSKLFKTAFTLCFYIDLKTGFIFTMFIR